MLIKINQKSNMSEKNYERLNLLSTLRSLSGNTY